jgi:hypothetical protein
MKSCVYIHTNHKQIVGAHVRHDTFEVIDRTPKLVGAWR